ncbi:hypothetical protein IJJ36_04015 [Candidatus Saccharibacteria bacterium]|nr:hypothetical protein [Candidatus Saccharibacteria bacterium]MBQ6461563.1 hypothetical protein [Candidatus Saccharibacteria bacterium]
MTNPFKFLAVTPGTDNTAGGVDYVAGGTGDELQGNIINIINGVVGALAIVAVIVIIIGGVQYMTSSGDAGKVKKAKDTILYGVIGLVICVLAFAIVNFVIKNIIG